MQNDLQIAYFIYSFFTLKRYWLTGKLGEKNLPFLPEVQNLSFFTLIVIFEIVYLLSDGVVLLIYHK